MFDGISAILRLKLFLFILNTAYNHVLRFFQPQFQILSKVQCEGNDSHVIGACPALFPCKNALPACNRLGVAQDTCLRRVTPVGSSREEKSLALET